jgi:hypothetical protein
VETETNLLPRFEMVVLAVLLIQEPQVVLLV